jgi:hypothetical protein
MAQLAASHWILYALFLFTSTCLVTGSEYSANEEQNTTTASPVSTGYDAWAPTVYVNEVAYAVPADYLLAPTVSSEPVIVTLRLPAIVLRLIDAALTQTNFTQDQLFDWFGDGFENVVYAFAGEFGKLVMNEKDPGFATSTDGHRLASVGALDALAIEQIGRVGQAYSESWPEGIHLDATARNDECSGWKW